MTITPLQFKALYTVYQDGLRERGRFVAPRDGLSRPCPVLVRRGLLEVVETRRVYGRYRKAKIYRAYRVTDAGRALLPAPSVPPVPVIPQRPRVLPAGELQAVRSTIANGWKDVHVWTHADGQHLTAFFRLEPLPHGQVTAYSLEAYAADMAVFVRRLLPHAAVTATAVHPARRFPGDELRAVGLKSGSLASTATIQIMRNARLVGWVSVTFVFQEDMPLLCAGEVVPSETGPSLLTIAPAAPSPSPRSGESAVSPRQGGVWPLALVPEEITPRMIWDDLTVEAQAALKLLAATPKEWQPVRGVDDPDLRVLDRELLIFWQRQLREARITARGLDLLEAVGVAS